MLSHIRSQEEYDRAYRHSVENPEGFWAEIAKTFYWKKTWDKVLDWNFDEPKVQWFDGGKLNITENCLDRHLPTRGNQRAIIWEPNDPNAPNLTLTYRELYEKVCQFANALKAQGIKKGDRICFYMPMVPELTIGMLACARIGAIHSIVFAGFSATSLSDRIKDSECKMVLCSDYNKRGNKNIPVKAVVDEALTMDCSSIEKVICLKHTGESVNWEAGRDVWWSDAIAGQATECPAEEMESEDPLFILYTSGSTGKPKGVVHTCGGYMIYAAYTFANVFRYDPGDVYWCTADIGWITGHSYIVYGPLANGAVSIMFEGVPTYPGPGRFWEVIEKYKVNQFYTAPTAIRALMAFGNDLPHQSDMSSLKVIGSVGEPINKEAWEWYFEHVGKSKIAVVDTWWQTETGGMMISNVPYINALKPTYAGFPLPGIQPCLLDKDGNELTEDDTEGLLCIKFPWPGIIRTTWGDHERCRTNYFATFKGMYFTGDGAKRDHDGRYRIIGRVDDVINVSGHRIGTAEVENAINEHEFVIESAVVGYPHDVKGQGIYAFVIVDKAVTDRTAFDKEMAAVVTKIIGPIAKPDKVQIVSGLPKTRSGKIMRRILRKIAAGEGDSLGDISTLLNPEVVEEIKQGAI